MQNNNAITLENSLAVPYEVKYALNIPPGNFSPKYP